jgi:hypothetical protein
MSYIIYSIYDEVALSKETEENLTLPHNTPAIRKKTHPAKKKED